jgi:hypothetical protein
LRDGLELFSIYALNQARKEKILSSLLQCNYRIFVLKHQAPQMHLPANGSQIQELPHSPEDQARDVERRRNSGRTRWHQRFRSELTIGNALLDWQRDRHHRSRRMRTNILFDEAADFAASIGAKRWPLFAQLPQAKALLSGPALTLKGT